MIVYELCGWFGSSEWSEGHYESEADAEAECSRLWETRSSPNAPDYCQGLCKFAVEPHKVIPAADRQRSRPVAEQTEPTEEEAA